MRQWHEITTAPTEPSLEFRQHAAIQRRQQQFDEFPSRMLLSNRAPNALVRVKHDRPRFRWREQRARPTVMMQQIDLMLRKIGIRHAKPTSGPKPVLMLIDRARLRGERFHELLAALDEGLRRRVRTARAAWRSAVLPEWRGCTLSLIIALQKSEGDTTIILNKQAPAGRTPHHFDYQNSLQPANHSHRCVAFSPPKRGEGWGGGFDLKYCTSSTPGPPHLGRRGETNTGREEFCRMSEKSILIIGAGVAGLATGSYAAG